MQGALGLIPTGGTIPFSHKDGQKRKFFIFKMMFEGEDCQAIQTLLDNNSITAEDQCIPVQVLNAIKTVIKEDKPFWHYCNEILCDL